MAGIDWEMTESFGVDGPMEPIFDDEYLRCWRCKRMVPIAAAVKGVGRPRFTTGRAVVYYHSHCLPPEQWRVAPSSPPAGRPSLARARQVRRDQVTHG